MASIDISSSIRIITLNCQGIKSNINYVNSLLLNECDMMFVCEHWLKPCDMYEANNSFRTDQYWCNLKSSMPADEVVTGCPYGGVGFICKAPPNCIIKDVPQDDNRISVIQILNNATIILTLVGVYLPFYHTSSSVLYNEILDKVHGIMETAGSPVILLGDMNAQLPGQQNLAVKWYRDRKFNNHSLFLHDFLSIIV